MKWMTVIPSYQKKDQSYPINNRQLVLYLPSDIKEGFKKVQYQFNRILKPNKIVILLESEEAAWVMEIEEWHLKIY